MNIKISVGNIKGGVGKTCVSALFAEYLIQKGFVVTVVDADIQASLFRHRQREMVEDPQQLPPWEIIQLGTLDPTKLKSDMEVLGQKDGIVIIDCPGNLSNDNLSIIYGMADLIVVPMAYDVDTIDATGIFLQAVKKMTSAPLVFVPNRINTTEGKAYELELRDETIAILGGYGVVTPRIKQSVVIKRYSTLHPLDKYQYAAVEHAFDKIIIEIKKLQKDG